MSKKVGRKPLKRKEIRERKELMQDYLNLATIAQKLLNSYRGKIITAENLYFMNLLSGIAECSILRKYLLQRKMSTLKFNRRKRRAK